MEECKSNIPFLPLIFLIIVQVAAHNYKIIFRIWKDLCTRARAQCFVCVCVETR